MTFRKLLTFDLPADFPATCGWLSAVRSRCRDRAAANFLRDRHPDLVRARDAESVIAEWRPVRAQMFYYLRLKQSAPCQFIATDGVFVHSVEALGTDWRFFTGPVERLLVHCHEVWHSKTELGEFPLVPSLAGYPGAIILHELGYERATIVTSAADQPKSQHSEEAPCLLSR